MVWNPLGPNGTPLFSPPGKQYRHDEPPPQRNDPNQKINYIIDFLMDPCDAPLTVYLRMAWPAFVKLVIAYYALDLIQIFTGWIRPSKALKMYRGAPHRSGHGKRGKSKTWLRRLGKWSSFDPWDELGRRLPFGKDLGGRQVSPRVAGLWVLYGIEQRFAYYMFMYTLFEDFFYDWFSGVARTEYCAAQRRPMFLGTSPMHGNFGVLEQSPINIPFVEKMRHANGGLGNVIHLYAKSTHVVINGKAAPLTEPQIPPECFLMITNSIGQTFRTEIPRTGGFISVTGFATEECDWFFWTTGNGLWTVNDVQVYGQGSADFDEA